MKSYERKLILLWPEHKAFCVLYAGMDALLFMVASLLAGGLIYSIGGFSIDWTASVISAMLIGFGVATMSSGAARALMRIHPVWDSVLDNNSESECHNIEYYEHDDFDTWFDEFKSEVEYEDWSPRDWAKASWDAARQ